MTEPTAPTITVPTLKFDVPNAPTAPPPLPVPVAVEQPIATGLSTVAQTPETRQAISCKDMIPPAELAKARAEADQLLVAMLKSTNVLMEYGQNSLAGVNALVDRMMREVAPASIPELKGIMRDLTLQMKSVKGKYDLTTPSGKHTYDEWENNRFAKWFRKGRNYLTSMLADMQSIDSQLATVAKDLEARKIALIRNVGLLDQLYAENEASIYKLIYVIAVMEIIAEEARKEAANIPQDTPSTGNANTELRQRLADLILQMDVKIGEYKGRLFVAWATSPQVRMMRMLNVGMAEKVNEAVGMTIPTMKLAIVQWRILAETQEAAKSTSAVADATNMMVTELARTSAIAGGAIMDVVQTPTILPETVTAVTDSMVQMAENILGSIEAGTQKRAELDRTMAASKRVLDGSQHDFDEAVITQIIKGSTQEVQLPSSRPVLALPSGRTI